MKRFFYLLLGGTCTAFVACGGVSGLDGIFQGESGGAATTSTTASSTASSTSTTTSTSTTSTSTTSTSTTSTSTTSTTTASSTASSSSVASSSSSTGGPPVQVFCANQPCQSGEICCFDTQGQGDFCGQTGQCGFGFIELQCNGPEDCPGQVCCGTIDQQMNPPYTGLQCQATCDQQNEVVICGNNPNICMNGTQCKPSQVLGQGYNVCRN